jgi:uncharacterized membrane protein YhaH (DUF805 family)
VIPVNYWISTLKKYAVFSGRARRSEYWFFTLVNICITFGFVAIEIALQLLRISDIVVEWAAFVFNAGTLLPSIAVAVRRLHDTGRKGWWIFLPLIPIVGFIAALIFYCEPGEPGENRYGPDPKALAEA